MELNYDAEILELISKPMKNDVNCLIAISGHKLLKADLVMFKVVLRKWFNRFRTSQISRRFSLINSRINQFIKLDLSNSLVNKLGNLVKEKFDIRSDKIQYPTYDQIIWVMDCSKRACEILCNLIRDIISVFEDCTLWIKLGHFARQMRIITAAVSRLSVFFKTIVMKLCDIYPYLFTYLEMIDYTRLNDDQMQRDIFYFVEKINVDPPKNQEIKSSSKIQFKSMYEANRNEDFGQKISRTLFNEKIKKKVTHNDRLISNEEETDLNRQIESNNLIVESTVESENLLITNKCLDDQESTHSNHSLDSNRNKEDEVCLVSKVAKRKNELNTEVTQSEIKALIKRFKREINTKKRMRRIAIRKSMEFEVDKINLNR